MLLMDENRIAKKKKVQMCLISEENEIGMKSGKQKSLWHVWVFCF